jgi:MFS family permease
MDSFVHNCFFNWTGRFLTTVGIAGNWVMPVMSIGQVAEILTMAVLGLFLKRLGWRTTMIIGILGHAARFAVFAFLNSPDYKWFIVGINALHGICYAFFFATVYIFVDEHFPKDVRSSAQGLFNLMILGIGALLANFVCPPVFEKYTTNGTTDFRGLFLIPCGVAVVAAVMLFLLFHPPRKPVADDAPAVG